ncbi:hypothetical protein BCR36DRAFT_292693, partial [Piromyces finnis]
WTWDKAFEYAEMIYDCTNEPGFQLDTNDHEVLKFFAGICQSLGIPFITEDDTLDIKTCGLENNKLYLKLSKLKKILQNHQVINYINIY